MSSVGGFTQIMNEQMKFRQNNVLDNRSDGKNNAIIEEGESNPATFVDDANLGLKNSEADSNKILVVDKPHNSQNDTTNLLAPV